MDLIINQKITFTYFRLTNNTYDMFECSVKLQKNQ